MERSSPMKIKMVVTALLLAQPLDHGCSTVCYDGGGLRGRAE